MCTEKMLATQDSKQNLLCFQILTQPKQWPHKVRGVILRCAHSEDLRQN